jgi:hypothetical protein
MQHFSEEVWADFVRGTGDAASAAIAAHLAEVCSDCTAIFSVWKQVKTIADNERQYSPAENVVHMPKVQFAASQFRHEESVTAKLTFDTFTQPLLAGVRSVTATARQMVFEADGLMMDLRFDQPTGSRQVHLTGQVLDKRVPRASSADAIVILWTGKGLPVAETRTNAFGEFHVEFQEQDRLRLSIQVGGRHIVRIPLADLRDIDGESDTSNH